MELVYHVGSFEIYVRLNISFIISLFIYIVGSGYIIRFNQTEYSRTLYTEFDELPLGSFLFGVKVFIEENALNSGANFFFLVSDVQFRFQSDNSNTEQDVIFGPNSNLITYNTTLVSGTIPGSSNGLRAGEHYTSNLHARLNTFQITTSVSVSIVKGKTNVLNILILINLYFSG